MQTRKPEEKEKGNESQKANQFINFMNSGNLIASMKVIKEIKNENVLRDIYFYPMGSQEFSYRGMILEFIHNHELLFEIAKKETTYDLRETIYSKIKSKKLLNDLMKYEREPMGMTLLKELKDSIPNSISFLLED